MQAFCLSDIEELAAYADDWDRLSGGVPFRSWAWLSSWWRNYGQARGDASSKTRLYVVCVFDHDDTLLGIAPWYLDCRGGQGRVLRMLGSGEVASDYLSLLCRGGVEHAVTQVLADHLSDDGPRADPDWPQWDLLELTDFDAQDKVAGMLIEQLAQRGNTIHRSGGPNCWRIELPHSWDDYLAMLSKSHRRQLRRLQRRMFDAGRAVLHSARRADQLAQALEILIDLHQRRRRALGQPGCFASRKFEAFFREVVPKMSSAGQLQFHWLEIDGKPAAAEIHLSGQGVVYAYQSGVDPAAIEQQPGRLITLATVRRAIERGYRAFDFLRGDEPYKAHFRARPRPSLRVRVVPRRAAAQLRHNVWLAGRNVKQWIKSGLKSAGAREES